MEQVLGIQATGAGFRTVSIRPDLAGLAWARGGEPTPRGLIRVNVERDKVEVGLPAGTIAAVSLPFAADGGQVFENGKPIATTLAEHGARSVVMLTGAGEYTFTKRARGVQ
jgi:hypothetical protein